MKARLNGGPGDGMEIVLKDLNQPIRIRLGTREGGADHLYERVWIKPAVNDEWRPYEVVPNSEQTYLYAWTGPEGT